MQRSEATQKKRVPIDNIKASGLRRQAKRRCLEVSAKLSIVLSLATLGLRYAQQHNWGRSARLLGLRLRRFLLHRSQARYADLANIELYYVNETNLLLMKQIYYWMKQYLRQM